MLLCEVVNRCGQLQNAEYGRRGAASMEGARRREEVRNQIGVDEGTMCRAPSRSLRPQNYGNYFPDTTLILPSAGRSLVFCRCCRHGKRRRLGRGRVRGELLEGGGSFPWSAG